MSHMTTVVYKFYHFLSDNKISIDVLITCTIFFHKVTSGQLHPLTCNMTGIAWTCIGVGFIYPTVSMFSMIRGCILYSIFSCSNVSTGSGISVPCTCTWFTFRIWLICRSKSLCISIYIYLVLLELKLHSHYTEIIILI